MKRKAPFKIIAAASVAGALSGLSAQIGFPLDAEYIAMHYIFPSCSVLGSWTAGCQVMIVSAIFLITAGSLLYLIKALRRMRKMSGIPGWVWGLMLYFMMYFASAYIAVEILERIIRL
jgi:hypothetical protein